MRAWVALIGQADLLRALPALASSISCELVKEEGGGLGAGMGVPWSQECE